MTESHHLISGNRLDLVRLAALADRPAPFAPHEAPFWTDPHIAQQMLAAHLDPGSDAASRRPETIERTVSWLIDRLKLRPGMRLLDLGCGPGLYCTGFARRGLRVTGVDFSESSLAYARRTADENGLAIEYVQADYRALALSGPFDAAVLIYYDFGVLADVDRAALLVNVRRLLRPDGAFVFDAMTPGTFLAAHPPTSWAACPDGGFWRPGPYLELTRTFTYLETATDVRQTMIVEPDGETTVYRIWSQSFTPETAQAMLSNHGFEIQGVWADLMGTPYEPGAGALGIVATASG